MSILYVALSKNISGVAETLSRRLPVDMIKPGPTRSVVEQAARIVQKKPMRLIVASEALEIVEDLPPLNPSNGLPQLRAVVEGLRENNIEIPVIMLSNLRDQIAPLLELPGNSFLSLQPNMPAPKFGIDRVPLFKEILRIIAPTRDMSAAASEIARGADNVVSLKGPESDAKEAAAPVTKKASEIQTEPTGGTEIRKKNSETQLRDVISFFPTGFYIFGRHLPLPKIEQDVIRVGGIPLDAPIKATDVRQAVTHINQVAREVFSDIGLPRDFRLVKPQGRMLTIARSSMRDIKDKLTRRHLDDGSRLGFASVSELMPRSYVSSVRPAVLSASVRSPLDRNYVRDILTAA